MMRKMRQKKDLAIEGMTARWYNRNARKHRLGEMKEYAKLVELDLQPGAVVLEVAPGPGYLSIELARHGKYKVIGVDISKTFVGMARENAREAGVEVDFREGSASDLRFPDGCFDAIVCTAAFKNFRDPEGALNEMYRVLKPRGTVLIVDMNRNATDAQIEELTSKMRVRGVEGSVYEGGVRGDVRADELAVYYHRGGGDRLEDMAGEVGCTGHGRPGR